MNRIFLALKARLYDYNAIKSDFSDVIRGRWVADENLHVTVCYFGDTYSIDELLKKLPELMQETEPLKLSSLGYFSNNGILYAKAASSKLDMLCSNICSHFPIPQIKPFIFHVTLMRIKEIKDKKVFEALLNRYNGKNIGDVETAMQLMRNSLSPGGSKYECIKRFEL